MANQILRARRFAMGFEIGGRCRQCHPGIANLAGDQAGVGGLAHAHGGVETFVDKAHQPIIEVYVKINIWIGCGEIEQCGGQLGGAEGYRRCQPQPPAGGSRPGFHRLGEAVEFFQQAADGLEIGLAHLGCRNCAGGAVEQAHAQIGFQRRHQLGRLAGTGAQPGRRLGEAPSLHDGHEHAFWFQALHGIRAPPSAAAW